MGLDVGDPDLGELDVGAPDLGLDVGDPDLGELDVGDPDLGLDVGDPDLGLRVYEISVTWGRQFMK